jgi:hypothetical protein
MTEQPTRRAIVRVKQSDPDQVAAYLPGNYRIVHVIEDDSLGRHIIIEGQDHAGWTLDDYVIPRLASGLYWAAEVDATVPVAELVKA